MKEEAVFLNGMPVHYKIVGQGPTILILHGWGSKSDKWVKVAELLSQHNFSVIVLDLPGFGRSDAPSASWSTEDYVRFVEQFAEKLGLNNFYLLGHSFGGGVAAVYSALHPQRMKRLFLVASAISRRKTARKTLFRVIASVFRIFSFLPFYGLLRKTFYKLIIQKSDYPYTSGVMKETYKRVIGNDLSSYLPSINVPTLIIWGDKDDVIPVADAYLIQEKIKNSQVVVISGGDHDIEQHMPEQLVATITTFLRP